MKTYSTTVYFKLRDDSEIPIRKTFCIEAESKEEASKELEKKVNLYKEKLEGTKGTKKPSEIASMLKSVKQTPEVDERLLRLLKGAYRK